MIAVVTDLRTRRIPDWLTLPAAALALLLRVALEGLGDEERGLASGLIGFGACFGLFAVFALVKKGLGWGDVKLMAAVGAAFGYPQALTALLLVSVAGAAQAIVVVIWRRAVFDTVRNMVRRLLGTGGETAARHIPYGVAIALGSLWAMWWDMPGPEGH
ncbi:MAG: prepilin peptidase [Deltaproteobacteria bacterium]|nr:prepilin peptidase [Deltaproteobacteria bacterium]